MPIRRPLLTEGLPPNPVFDPAFLALVGAYYQIAAGVVVPAAHAASHQTGGADPLALGSIATALAAGRILFPGGGVATSDAQLHWDNTNKWLLVGPTTPSTAPVDITRGAGLSAFFRLRGNAQTTAAGQIYLDVYADGTGYGLQGYGAGGLVLGTNGLVRQVISSAGNIGFNRAIPLYAMHNSNSFAKTDTTQRQLWFMSTNELAAANPFGLLTSVRGAAALANRAIELATTDYNVAWGGILALQRDGGQVAVSMAGTAPASAMHVGGTGLTVGASGTPVTQVRVYTPNLTPANVAANTTAEQTFAVVGLATTDTVTVNVPGLAAGVGLVGARVSAADTLALTFGNFTGGALAPAAGVYRVLAHRS